MTETPNISCSSNNLFQVINSQELQSRFDISFNSYWTDVNCCLPLSVSLRLACVHGKPEFFTPFLVNDSFTRAADLRAKAQCSLSQLVLTWFCRNLRDSEGVSRGTHPQKSPRIRCARTTRILYKYKCAAIMFLYFYLGSLDSDHCSCLREPKSVKR